MGAMLKVGDTVSWKGSWGCDLPYVVKVTSIDVVTPGDKEGVPVQEAPWALAPLNAIVAGLDNGHWAYGTQLSQIS
jgi:hypothetical protein